MDSIDLKITNEQKHFSRVQNTAEYNVDEKKKLAQVSKQFESLLTSMMLKSMTQTSGGMFGDDSFGGDYFETIFESEIASKISEGKGLGIADMLYQKMTGEKLPTDIINTRLTPVKKLDKINVQKTESQIPMVSPSNESLNRLEKYESIIEQAAETFGVDKNIIKSVILAESAGKQNALSSANAKGLMQLIDSTAQYLGVNNVWDPKENIMGGTKYLSQLLRQYDGNLKLALAGYNAGPGNVDKYNGIPPFQETQNYVTRVMGYLKHFEM